MVPHLILASSSPRRKQIVGLLGIPYSIVVVPVSEEPLPGEAPEATARRLALAKAQAAAGQAGSGVVIGADTIVVLDGAILGKPADAREALAMLQALRARSHDVITGVAVLDAASGRSRVSATSTEVRMRAYSDDEIVRYVASGEPFDKAGAYAVQSSAFHPADRVGGCYLNVVGLPLCTLAAELYAIGFPLPPMPAERLASVCTDCPRRGFLAKGCT